jgi:hypothetical protein
MDDYSIGHAESNSFHRILPHCMYSFVAHLTDSSLCYTLWPSNNFHNPIFDPVLNNFLIVKQKLITLEPIHLPHSKIKFDTVENEAMEALPGDLPAMVVVSIKLLQSRYYHTFC